MSLLNYVNNKLGLFLDISRIFDRPFVYYFSSRQYDDVLH
jgi:hypothetical protein